MAPPTTVIVIMMIVGGGRGVACLLMISTIFTRTVSLHSVVGVATTR